MSFHLAALLHSLDESSNYTIANHLPVNRSLECMNQLGKEVDSGRWRLIGKISPQFGYVFTFLGDKFHSRSGENTSFKDST